MQQKQNTLLNQKVCELSQQLPISAVLEYSLIIWYAGRTSPNICSLYTLSVKKAYKTLESVCVPHHFLF
jgi:hypothetical protein